MTEDKFYELFNEIVDDAIRENHPDMVDVVLEEYQHLLQKIKDRDALIEKLLHEQDYHTRYTLVSQLKISESKSTPTT